MTLRHRQQFAAEGSVLGIDVGFSLKRKSSAVCRLDWNQQEIRWITKRFGAGLEEREFIINDVAGENLLHAVALDGPLRAGFDTIGQYRLAERMLTRRLQPKIGKPGQSSAPVGIALNKATNACAMIVKRTCRLVSASHAVKIDDVAIVEAFPSSFLGLMLQNPTAIEARRGNRSDLYFMELGRTGTLENLLKFLLPNRILVASLATITNHDERAAFVSAITALCVATRHYTAVGDDNGWIILPPRNFIMAWALEDLATNLKGEPVECLYFSPAFDIYL